MSAGTLFEKSKTNLYKSTTHDELDKEGESKRFTRIAIAMLRMTLVVMFLVAVRTAPGILLKLFYHTHRQARFGFLLSVHVVLLSEN